MFGSETICMHRWGCIYREIPEEGSAAGTNDGSSGTVICYKEREDLVGDREGHHPSSARSPEAVPVTLLCPCFAG